MSNNSIQKYVDWCHENNLKACRVESVLAYEAYKKALIPVRVVK